MDAMGHINEAIRTRDSRDEMLRKAGFAAPSDEHPQGSHIIPVTAAGLTLIWSGMVTDDWACVAEGFVTLCDRFGFKPWEHQS